MELVSIVIPVYNGERYIEECVDSILGQTYKDIEIVICDDCSRDNTLQCLKKYMNNSRIILLRNKENLHQAATRNRCIAESHGDFIMIQDADDRSVPDRVEKLLKAFQKGIDFVGSGCYCYDDSGIFGKLHGRRKYPVARDFWWGIPFVHASIMFDRRCLDDVGGYRTSRETQRGEDYDLIMRIYAKGYRGKNIEDLLYAYRVDRDTYARRTFGARIDECIIRFKGYKANHILFPLGWFFILKPIPAYFYQIYRNIRGNRGE